MGIETGNQLSTGSTTSAATWAAASFGTSCGSTGRCDDATVKDQALNAFKPDGSPVDDTNRQWWHTEKVSFQLSPSNRIIGFYQGLHTQGRDRADELGSLGVAGAEDRQDALWQGRVGGRARQLAHRLGPVRACVSIRGDGILGAGVGREDLVTERITGENMVTGEQFTEARPHQGLADVVQAELVPREP